jgi:peptide/nickel transport system substrate-binding protein
VGDALRLIRDDVALIPLYRRQHSWAMRPGVELVQWPNDVVALRWVTLK